MFRNLVSEKMNRDDCVPAMLEGDGEIATSESERDNRPTDPQTAIKRPIYVRKIQGSQPRESMLKSAAPDHVTS